MKEDASPPRPQPSRQIRDWAVMAGYLVVVAVATLKPGTASSRLPLWCVTCTDLWLLDLLQNVVLFVPFGWLARRLGVGIMRAVLLGSAISLGIEGVQWVLPALGRDPILGDWLANTAGTALGAALPALWRWCTAPGPAWGRLALSVAWAVGVWWGSWWLVQPAWPTDSDWYGQPAAQLGHLDTLPGRLVRGSVNGIPVPFQLRPADVLHDGTVILAASIAVVSRSDGVAPAVSVFDGHQREVVLLGTRDELLILRARTRAATIGLPTPSLFSRRRTESGNGTTGDWYADVRPGRWCLSDGPSSPTCVEVGPRMVGSAIVSELGGASLSPHATQWAGTVGWWGITLLPLAVALLRARSGEASGTPSGRPPPPRSFSAFF